MKLSVIVPAYKQEKTIRQDLKNIEAALQKIPYDYEVIVVVDGKVDGTFEEAQKSKSPKIKIVGYETNRGKGHAVRFGVARASGELICFLDAGMDINPNSISMLLEHMNWYKADVIIGSKRHPVSQVDYAPIRRLYSFGYQILVWLLFGLKVRDTQVGLKIFRREVLEKVLPRLLVKRWAFDIEILSVAHSLGFKRIYEAPIILTQKISSNVNLGTVWNMLFETLAVFYRLKILRYYDDTNKRKWVYDPELDFKVNIG